LYIRGTLHIIEYYNGHVSDNLNIVK